MKKQEIQKPYYIPVFFETNSISAEKLVGGILFFIDEKIIFRYAENKIQASVLLGNIGSAKLIRAAMENLAEKVQSQKEFFSPQYMDYLHRYSNGLIQFGQAQRILLSLKDFDFFARKFLGEKIDLKRLVFDKLKSLNRQDNQLILGDILLQKNKKPYKVLCQNSEKTVILQVINLDNSIETARKQLRQYALFVKDYALSNKHFALLTQKFQGGYQEEIMTWFKAQVPECQIISVDELDDFIHSKLLPLGFAPRGE
jgi:hypothetical protein